MTEEFQKQSEQKIHLTMKITFASSRDNDYKRLMHSNSDNTEIMIGEETNEIIHEFFESHHFFLGINRLKGAV